VAIKDIAFA